MNHAHTGPSQKHTAMRFTLRPLTLSVPLFLIGCAGPKPESPPEPPTAPAGTGTNTPAVTRSDTPPDGPETAALRHLVARHGACGTGIGEVREIADGWVVRTTAGLSGQPGPELHVARGGLTVTELPAATTARAAFARVTDAAGLARLVRAYRQVGFEPKELDDTAENATTLVTEDGETVRYTDVIATLLVSQNPAWLEGNRRYAVACVCSFAAPDGTVHRYSILRLTPEERSALRRNAQSAAYFGTATVTGAPR